MTSDSPFKDIYLMQQDYISCARRKGGFCPRRGVRQVTFAKLSEDL